MKKGFGIRACLRMRRVKTKGPLVRPLRHSSGSDNKPAVLDGDLDALAGFEAGMLESPRESWRLVGLG
jgi:hypothetical protein